MSEIDSRDLPEIIDVATRLAASEDDTMSVAEVQRIAAELELPAESVQAAIEQVGARTGPARRATGVAWHQRIVSGDQLARAAATLGLAVVVVVALVLVVGLRDASQHARSPEARWAAKWGSPVDPSTLAGRPPPAITGAINAPPGALPAEASRALDRALASHLTQTGVRIGVLVVDSTHDAPLHALVRAAAQGWSGPPPEDDAVLIAVSRSRLAELQVVATQRLAGALPEATLRRLQRALQPTIARDLSAGVQAAVAQIIDKTAHRAARSTRPLPTALGGWWPWALSLMLAYLAFALGVWLGLPLFSAPSPSPLAPRLGGVAAQALALGLWVVPPLLMVSVLWGTGLGGGYTLALVGWLVALAALRRLARSGQRRRRALPIGAALLLAAATLAARGPAPTSTADVMALMGHTVLIAGVAWAGLWGLARFAQRPGLGADRPTT